MFNSEKGRYTDKNNQRCIWIVDTHLHLHKQYNLRNLFQTLAGRLQGYAVNCPDVELGAIFLEMRIGYTWEDLCSGAIEELRCFTSKIIDDNLVVMEVNGVNLNIFRGAQIVSSEGVEILVFLPKRMPSSAIPFKEIVNEIEEMGAFCVLPWSLGKWAGHRKKIVNEILVSRDIHLGDIAMRWWGDRSSILDIFNSPKKKRFNKIFYGSDPLPIRGEEQVVGGLVTRFILDPMKDEFDFNQESAPPRCRGRSDEFLNALRKFDTVPDGQYQNRLGALWRWVRIMGNRLKRS